MHLDESPESLVGRVAIVDPSGAWSYSELYKDPFGLRQLVSEGSFVALRTSSTLNVAAAVIALEGWAMRVHLIPPDVDLGIISDGSALISAFEQKQNNSEQIIGASNFATEWILYTSGTTGTPKPIRHSLASLSRTISSSKYVAELTWGMIYDPNRMAGIQVLLQSLTSLTTLVVPNPYVSLKDRIKFLRENAVTALSATPTLWRQVLQVAELQNWDLKQITLGGEISDQKILDALSEQFPAARIAHIFASTETGAAFAVTDKHAGFPISYLSEDSRGIRLEVRDNILYIFSPLVTGSPADGFVSTEDEVEIVGDRVLFRGRKSGVVNIGGSKVWPEEVERILRTHEFVTDAAVLAKSNPFTGAILTAKVVATLGAPTDLEKQLRMWMKCSSPPHYVPATITVVDSLTVSQAGKVERT